jgi:hypothetical protein
MRLARSRGSSEPDPSVIHEVESGDLPAPFRGRPKDAVVTHEVRPRRWNQRCEAAQQLARLENEHLAAVAQEAFHAIGELAISQREEPLLREGWPSLSRIKELLLPRFEIESISSIDPGGDRGTLWWVENRWVRGGMGRIIGKQRWRSLLESLRLGRELTITARKVS